MNKENKVQKIKNTMSLLIQFSATHLRLGDKIGVGGQNGKAVLQFDYTFEKTCYCWNLARYVIFY
jgi:hypothetical protein